MKHIITILIFFYSLPVSCQTTIDNKDSSDNYFISKMETFIRQNDNLNISNDAKYQNLYTEIATFIRQHPKREISFLFIFWAINLKKSQLESLLQSVDTSIYKSSYKAYTDFALRRIKVSETGKPFPELTLTDTIGNKISIADLKGKVVLIDFWSSWCKPCREQIPELKSLYKKYKNQGFEIIGISLDEDKSKWLNAMAKDKQTWNNYCEFINWRSNKIATRFAIGAIPANFLIDKNGILLGQDLSVDKIRSELAKQY